MLMMSWPAVYVSEQSPVWANFHATGWAMGEIGSSRPVETLINVTTHLAHRRNNLNRRPVWPFNLQQHKSEE